MALHLLQCYLVTAKFIAMKQLYFLLSALDTIKYLQADYCAVNSMSNLFIWLYYDTVSTAEVM
jgi:hypothetical protein